MGLLFGTNGDMLEGTQDLKDMFCNPENYGIKDVPPMSKEQIRMFRSEWMKQWDNTEHAFLVPQIHLPHGTSEETQLKKD